MMAKPFGRAIAIWLLLMAAEVVHGIARTLWLTPIVGDFRARQIAVFSGSLLIVTITTITVRWLHAPGARALWAIGLLWVTLTLAFEIGLGRFVFGFSWNRLASDYNLRAGGLLPIGLLVMAMAPWLAARLRGA